jgi:SAM-dependent methyltransferase
MIVRLDFGGSGRRARSIGVAGAAGPNVQILAELGPRLPFKDGTVDEVFLDHTLAHREEFVPIMEELWRICRPSALVHVRVPHASSPWALSRDARHSRHYTLETFNYFDPRFNDPACTSPATFRVEQSKLYLAGARRSANGLATGPVARVIESVANRNRGMQYRWERWFAPLIGGFEELYVALSVIKDRRDG